MSKPHYDPRPLRAVPPVAADPAVRRTPLRVPGPRETFWIVSPGLCETFEHYTGVRRLGCLVMHGQPPCPWCREGLGTQRRWWLTVCRAEGPNAPTEVVALTHVAVQSAPKLFEFDGFLWGRRLTLWRHPPVPNGTMYAELNSDESPKDLPRAEPTLHTVIRLWQAATRPETLRRQSDHDSATGDGPPVGGV